MRLASIIGNPNGSAYYRQALIVKALLACGHTARTVQQWMEGTTSISGYDVLHVGRIFGPDALGSVRLAQQRGKVVLVDYDDDILNLPPHNPAFRADKAAQVRAIVAAADGVIVTNDTLASVYRPHAQRIAIIPNYVDVSDWPARSRTGHDPCRPVIGLFGSPSHALDWEMIAEPMRRIRAEFPHVGFLVAGFIPDYLAELATITVPWVPLDQYREVVNQIDIGLCPLRDDQFNRAKTPIKAYEYGLAGAAVVGSPTIYRTTLQGRGIVARSEDEWYTGITTYIVDLERRRSDAAALTAYVKRLDVLRNARGIAATIERLVRDITRS